MAQILLGNVAPVEPRKVDDQLDVVEKVPLDIGDTITVANTVPGDGLISAVRSVCDPWFTHHSDAPPAWVDGNDEDLVRAIARHFSDLTGEEVPVGCPEDWAQPHLPLGRGDDEEPVAGLEVEDDDED